MRNNPHGGRKTLKLSEKKKQRLMRRRRTGIGERRNDGKHWNCLISAKTEFWANSGFSERSIAPQCHSRHCRRATADIHVLRGSGIIPCPLRMALMEYTPAQRRQTVEKPSENSKGSNPLKFSNAPGDIYDEGGRFLRPKVEETQRKLKEGVRGRALASRSPAC